MRISQFQDGVLSGANFHEIIHASAITSSIESMTTTGRYSGTFTAPNTVNNCTGVYMCLNSLTDSSPVVTTTLEYDTTGTGDWITVATNTMSTSPTYGKSSRGTIDSWVWFEWSTAYQWQSAASNRYRVKQLTSGEGNEYYMAYYRAATNTPAVCVVHDNIVTPNDNDNIWTVYELEIDTDITLGTANDDDLRPYTNQLSIAYCSDLNSKFGRFINTGDNTITLVSSMYIGAGCNAGKDTVISGSLHYYLPEQGSNDFGIYISPLGRSGFTGASVTNEGYATYVSGVGTTASPLEISQDIDLAVGVRLAIGSGDSRGNSEDKYVRTVIDSTHCTLSNTSGGAESGLSHTKIPNKTPIISLYSNFTISCDNYNNQDVIIKDACGGGLQSQDRTAESKWTNILVKALNTSSFTHSKLNRMIIIDSDGKNGGAEFTDTLPHAHTNCRGAFGVGSSGYLSGCYRTSSVSANQTLQDFILIGWKSNGIYMRGSTHDIIDPIINDCNRGGRAEMGGIEIQGATNCQILGGTLDANNDYAINVSDSVSFTTIGTVLGDQVQNERGALGIYNSGAVFDIIFDRCDLSNDKSIGNNYQSGAIGSKFTLHYCTLDGINSEYESINYYTNGITRRSGKDADDTSLVETVTRDSRTEGNGAFMFEPTDANSPVVWSFKVAAKANTIVKSYAYFLENTAFYNAHGSGSNVSMELWLPGSTSADASVDVSTDDITSANTWCKGQIEADWNQNYDDLATVVVKVKGNTTGNKIYVTDIWNGLNEATGLRVWKEGSPSEIMALVEPSVISGVTVDYTSKELTNVTEHYWGQILSYADSFFKDDEDWLKVINTSSDGLTHTFANNWNYVNNNTINATKGMTFVFSGTGKMIVADGQYIPSVLTVTGDLDLGTVIDLDQVDVSGTLTLATAGTYKLSKCTIGEVVNTSGGNITLELDADSFITTNTGPNITITAPSKTLTIKGVPTSAEVRLYVKDATVGVIGSSELWGVESHTGGDINYTITTTDITMLQVMKDGYVEYVTTIYLADGTQTHNVNLIEDNN